MKNKVMDTLLLVGDRGRLSLRSIFESKFYLLEAENAAQGVLLLQQNFSSIAAVVADIPLSSSEELQTLADACRREELGSIPLIAVIEPSGTGENEEYAFILGATDVVLKPYTTLSIQRRVQVLVDLYSHQQNLEQQLSLQKENLQRNRQIMIDTLSSMIENRSAEPGNHVLRIRRFTQLLLEVVARNCPEYGLDDTIISIITSASAMHDIGKIAVPDHILNKPGPLTAEEFAIMQTHTTVGSQLAEQFNYMNDALYLRYIYNITLYHHERWDGKGYPMGLAGDDIPICAQVVGIADVFDALTSKRSYKPAYSSEKAINMILNGECGAFSPKLLECLKRASRDFSALAQQYSDGYSPLSDSIRLPLANPAPPVYDLDSPQLFHQKYQTLLHHLNDTVIEMDMDAHMYHVVSNPNPNFVSLLSGVSFQELPQRLFRDAIHPEDISLVSAKYGECMTQIFHQGSHSAHFHCRIYSPPHQTHLLYKITLQRISTENPQQRLLLIVFHALESQPAPSAVSGVNSLLSSTTTYDLQCATLCCLNDRQLTIREGINSLIPLTGWQTDEFWHICRNSLLELTAEEDQTMLLSKMHSQNIRSGKIEFDLRLRTKEGNPIWVQCRSRAHIGQDGAEYCFLTLTDITRQKLYQQRLENSVERSKILLGQAGSIIFEWDLVSDQFYCSEKWEARFGHNLPTEEFSQILSGSNHVHPDDLPLLRSKAQGMQNGHATDVIDLRIANSEGSYFWSRIRATAIFDQQGTPTHIIGIVHDIDQLKMDALSMQQQAQKDALTRLLNKASSQQEISSYLSVLRRDSFAALLVMDLDNFKTVNDTLGHFYGDAVLAQVGSTLQGLFRAHDVIGRIGGDEFMILLKDVPSREIVEDRCRLLTEAFQTLLHKLMPTLPVSVSVGAALVPQHGNTYEELYRCADEALYSAKRRGKNRYCIYDPQDKFTKLSHHTAAVTRIESDRRSILTGDSLLQYVFQHLSESRDTEAAVEEILGFIGTHFNVSRVYVFENNDDNTACSNTFEWCNLGIHPEKENLQNISYETDLPGWESIYDENGILYCTDISQLPPLARAIVEPQGIKSMLHCTIRDKGVFRGYVGFDECTANHLWTQEQVASLKLLAGMLSVFIIRLRIDQKQAAQPL